MWIHTSWSQRVSARAKVAGFEVELYRVRLRPLRDLAHEPFRGSAEASGADAADRGVAYFALDFVVHSGPAGGVLQLAPEGSEVTLSYDAGDASWRGAAQASGGEVDATGQLWSFVEGPAPVGLPRRLAVPVVVAGQRRLLEWDLDVEEGDTFVVGVAAR